MSDETYKAVQEIEKHRKGCKCKAQHDGELKARYDGQQECHDHQQNGGK